MSNKYSPDNYGDDILDDIDKERLGVVIASGIGGVITLLDQFDIFKEKGARAVSPHTVPMLMPNGPAANVGLELQAKAGVHTPVSACASGAESRGSPWRSCAIRWPASRGEANPALCSSTRPPGSTSLK